MPDGVVSWIEPSSGKAAIMRGGHSYGARFSDIEPAARHVGARVHFDIKHGAGAESAVDVRIRGGMRTDPHHRQFGNLAGAHDVEAGAVTRFARRHAEYRPDLGTHPLQVVSAWAQQLAAGDLDEALSLYSPDAAMHLDYVALVARRHIRHRLEALPVFASGRLPAVRGDQGLVVARWEAPNAREQAVEVHSRVRHGLIVEQWITPPSAEAGMSGLETSYGPIPLATVTQGEVPPDALDYAIGRVHEVAERIEEPILSVRIKLSVAPDPARSRPALAQVSLNINGQVVRSHVAAHETREAVDLLALRLTDRLGHRAQRIDALRRHSPGRSEVGEWRRGDLPAVRPEFFDRPAEERQLVRHKAFFASEQSLDEAIFDMDLLDYDFYLFSELASGRDSLLERLPGGVYRLYQLHPVAAGTAPSAYPVDTDLTPVPELTIDGAIERLVMTGDRFVFFTRRDSGRGSVIYQRYDGHYGLITLE